MSRCNFLPNVGPGTDTCCERHDRHYVAGSGVSRLDADKMLLDCLLINGNPRWKAYLAYYAVRLFGWIFYKGKK